MRAADALAESKNLPAVRLLEAVGVDAFRDALSKSNIDAGDAALGLDAALGTIAVTPLAADRQVIAALTHHGQGDLAWKTGTSSGRRDAWSIGITATHVIVVWLGNL